MTNNKDAQITVLPEEEKDTRLRGHESMSVIVWRRFRKHPGAVAGAIVLTLLVVAILLAPLSPYDPEPSSLSEKLQPPSWQHPFGTDSLGRDMLTRVLYGGRISLFVGFMATVCRVHGHADRYGDRCPDRCDCGLFWRLGR
jgi:peptide/nickel transport system permease protein